MPREWTSGRNETDGARRSRDRSDGDQAESADAGRFRGVLGGKEKGTRGGAGERAAHAGEITARGRGNVRRAGGQRRGGRIGISGTAGGREAEESADHPHGARRGREQFEPRRRGELGEGRRAGDGPERARAAERTGERVLCGAGGGRIKGVSAGGPHVAGDGLFSRDVSAAGAGARRADGAAGVGRAHGGRVRLEPGRGAGDRRGGTGCARDILRGGRAGRLRSHGRARGADRRLAEIHRDGRERAAGGGGGRALLRRREFRDAGEGPGIFHGGLHRHDVPTDERVCGV